MNKDEIIESQKRVINALQHENAWLTDVIYNPTFNEVDMRLMVENTPREMRMGLISEGPEKKVYYPAMAEKVHCSDKVASQHLRALAKKTNAFAYKNERDPETGNSHVTLQALMPAATPATLTFDKPQRGGSIVKDGKRVKRCPECKSPALVKRTQYWCQNPDCLHQWEEGAWSPVNNLDDLSDNDPDSQYDSRPPDEEEEDARLAHPEDTRPYNSFWGGKEETDPDRHIGTDPAEPEEISNLPSSTIPNTPPVVGVEDAATFLLEIAGEHTEHIEMIPTAQKYTTVARSLHQEDMRAHLRGDTSKGARLYRSDGLTRSLCFDADSKEDMQRKREAARDLAAMDFKPLLEEAPLPETCKHAGGGKLWIVFDGLVDAYSALQTVYQYTGGLLKHSKEHWPPETDTGNRVRLPGGKYVHPDFTEWCSLYDAYGNELSHDGAGAAAVLLAYQTPAHLVNAYARPEPTPEPERTKPAPRLGGYLEKDLARQAIADFNASHSWAEIVGGFNRHGKFEAIWRGDRNPNCAVDPQTDLAKDFSTNAWFTRSFDKYECWCLIEGKEHWEAFKRLDLAQRCAQLREAGQERRAS